MKLGDTTRTVIGKAIRKRHLIQTVQVVYKTFIGRHKGRVLYSSRTRHEKV